MSHAYLYDDNGYINFARIKRLKLPFNFLISPRGAGKTYTVLSDIIESEEYLFFSRRTQEQQEMVCNKLLSPFSPINDDKGYNIGFSKFSKNVYEIREMEIDDDGKERPAPGPELGMAAALFSISKLRGFSARKVKYWVIDEFIPEPHERTFRGEDGAFLNAYETINRNRELDGQEPVYTYLLGNANNIEAGMLKEFGLMKDLEKMIKKGVSEYINRDRGVGIWLFYESPVAAKKKDTALYKFAKGTKFADMAIDNKFVNYDTSMTESRNLKEYLPVAAIGTMCLYLHKSKAEVYITSHISGSPELFEDNARGREAFIRKYNRLWLLYLNKQVFFSDVELLSKFINMYSTKRLE